MASPVRELFCDDWNVENVFRHHVTPGEVAKVCFEGPWILRGREGKRSVFGQTFAGRYLLVILADRGSGLFYPITARDMTEPERRRYRQAKG